MEDAAQSPAPSPLALLQRWLVQLRYGNIRRLERGFDAIRDDTKKSLRGVCLADTLVITRQLIFFELIGRRRARAISLEEVAARYSLSSLQENYRVANEARKTAVRKKAG